MGHCILHKDGAYNIYSSVVDAPLFTEALTLEQLEQYIEREHGRAGLRRLPERLERAHRLGSSSLHNETLEQAICANRAGPGETCMSAAQFIAKYMTLERA